MTATLPTTGRISTRRQAGLSLAGIGALLAAFSMLMLVFAAPSARADHNGFPHNDSGGCNPLGYGNLITAAWKRNSDDTYDFYNLLITDVVTSISSPLPLYTQVGPDTNTDTWFNWDYVGPAGFTLVGIVIKNGSTETGYPTSVDPGSHELSAGGGAGWSHTVLCFITNSTTTIAAESTTTSTSTSTTTSTSSTTTSTSTTTTTIGGPSTTTTTLGTTTTAGATTTTVGGPCDPNDPDCLPNTGAGSLLLILAGGLGLLFVGVGILMVADDRGRQAAAG